MKRILLFFLLAFGLIWQPVQAQSMYSAPGTPQELSPTSSPTFAGLTLTAPLSTANGGTGGNSAATGRTGLGLATLPNGTTYTRVSVSAPEILSLSGSPKTLIAAPGSNKVIVIHAAAVKYAHVTTAYTGGSSLRISIGGSQALTDLGASTLTSASTKGGFLGRSVSPCAAAVINGACTLSVTGADFATGDGTLTYDIVYSVWDLP